jgi:c-di-GMP-binding flagellar brake protein YcgR
MGEKWWFMFDEQQERRRYQRTFFSIEERIKGIFAFSDHQRGLLTASIINISEGGLGLALSKDKQDRIAKGDCIILTHITGIEGLESLTNVEAEIKWVVDNPSLEFLGFGCEFLDASESIKEAIRLLIDARHGENTIGDSEGQGL